MNHSPTPPMVPVPWRPERKMRGRLMLGKSVVRDAGGLGSGRSSGRGKTSVEECIQLDVNQLSRCGVLIKGSRDSWSWSTCGHPLGSIGADNATIAAANNGKVMVRARRQSHRSCSEGPAATQRGSVANNGPVSVRVNRHHRSTVKCFLTLTGPHWSARATDHLQSKSTSPPG